ncbi:hypothetical protein PIB30_010913 [Stylosanthes scabra]|uniref:Uncharacterized protein n=1 Tax=Stylosanthes scabra TaxID=79078 RepID=A0ABU6T6L0_9FABA|nr:hypothetical protein [Stylosanthes scabra]
MNPKVVRVVPYTLLEPIRGNQFLVVLEPPQQQQGILMNQLSNPQVLKIIKCFCSPSNHPLAYKCNLHNNNNKAKLIIPPRLPVERRPPPKYTSNNMLLLKTAIKNSMLKNGADKSTVEQNFIIKRKPPRSRPCCKAFREIKPSRLSTMSKAEDFDL